MSEHFFKDVNGQLWIKEEIASGMGQCMRVDKVLFEDMSEHQHLTVFENEKFGRVLALNGIIQVTRADEYIYHEMISHIPVFAHGSTKKVLVIGGGDGGVIREVLRHEAIESVTMVEIEQAVVDFSLKWLPEISDGAFENEKLNLIITDGAQFVKNSAEHYDVIIVDSTDPVGPGEVLFTEEFYKDCSQLLNPGGILITQCGVPFLQAEELKNALKRQKRSFEHVSFYVLSNASYYGGHMTLGFATNNIAALQCPPELIARRIEGSGLSFKYYGPEVHQAAFALPAYIQNVLDKA